MIETSCIELSRSALGRNVRYLKRRLGPGVRLTSVVKGNAYGHGIDVFVPLAEEAGVRSFAVFSAEEAQAVVAARTRRRTEVTIMGAADPAAIEWAVAEGVSFYVFDLGRLEAAAETAARVGAPARVHLELETGMHRLGLEAGDLEPAVELLRACADRFVVEGVSTHFAGAESIANHVRIERQIGVFHERLAWLEARGVKPRYRHAACSAAALVYPETVLDMARIGIAQYGYWPSQETRMRVALERGEPGARRFVDPLKRVISWKSRVMALKRVAAGEFVGYGSSYLANTPRRVAIVPVGYASGFTRRLSNRGRVLIRGRRHAVIGLVNMNMITVDVTEARDVRVGDEVVLIGRQKSRDISVSSFSEMSQFLNYEMLVRLPREIPRRVVP